MRHRVFIGLCAVAVAGTLCLTFPKTKQKRLAMTDAEHYLTGLHALANGRANTLEDVDALTEPLTDAQLLEMNQDFRENAERCCDWIVARVCQGNTKAKILRARNGIEWAEGLDTNLRILKQIESVAKHRTLPLSVWTCRKLATELLNWLKRSTPVMTMTPARRRRALRAGR